MFQPELNCSPPPPSPADWRPGRTVVLCSWDAEEYGLIGSTEWVEVGREGGGGGGGGRGGVVIVCSCFHRTKASCWGLTLAYLNVDAGVSGMRCIKVAMYNSYNPCTCTLRTVYTVYVYCVWLYEVSWQAAKLVKCPNADFDTVYDEWLHFTPKDYNGEQKPL